MTRRLRRDHVGLGMMGHGALRSIPRDHARGGEGGSRRAPPFEDPGAARLCRESHGTHRAVRRVRPGMSDPAAAAKSARPSVFGPPRGVGASNERARGLESWSVRMAQRFWGESCTFPFDASSAHPQKRRCGISERSVERVAPCGSGVHLHLPSVAVPIVSLSGIRASLRGCAGRWRGLADRSPSRRQSRQPDPGENPTTELAVSL